MIHKSFLTLALILFSVISHTQDRLSGKSFATRSEVIAKNGMVATNHPIASQIAIEILKKGGSAVDAAIASNAFLGFADPAMNGIGGDLFAIIWSAKNEKLYAINASGRSAQNMTLKDLQDKGLSSIPGEGPLGITVPGCVDGWFEMHDKFGRLPMKDLLAPAISYAKEGIPVSQEIADMMEYLDRSLLKSYTRNGDLTWEKLPDFNKVYRKNGRFPVKGEIYKNEALAATLQKISTGGKDAFYKGPISKLLVQHIQNLGGFLSEEDFSDHKSEWVDPVSTDYRGHTVWEIPPNGQGVSVLQMLNILEGYDMEKFGFGSKEHIHYFTESKKLAYADLSQYYGDPDFSDIPLSTLLSKEYANKRRAEIDPESSKNYGPGLDEDSHTIYLTVADSEGNMVSLIQSNSWLFGSLVVSPELGFCLQNRGTGFKLQEGHMNSYAPAKRPFHTIIPAFITKEGKPYVSFGLTGGGMQPQGHVQIIMNLLDFKMNLQEAGDAPRIRHEYSHGRASRTNTGSIRLESGFPYPSIRELMKMGHDVSYGFERFGGYQAILYDGTVYYGASESRKDGQAAGY